MLASILLFGVLHHAATSDIAKQSGYVTRPIATCPAEGYFLKREASLNNVDPICYLCFCDDDTTAICWRRENKRCDLKHYHNTGDARVRRSPLSLGEDSIRNAARKFFSKQSPDKCKPYESSFSSGCPPVDWCIGCTVCDCNANGRWDCHVLSFCPDKNGMKQAKERGGSIRNRIGKRQSKSFTTKDSINPDKKPPKKPAIKALYKQNVKKSQMKQNGANRHKIDPVNGTKMKKIASMKKMKSKLQAKKISSNTKRGTENGNPLFVKRGPSTNKSINKKPNIENTSKNNNVEVPQEVVKQFLSTIQKLMRNDEKKTENDTKQSNKIVRKRNENFDNKTKLRAKSISTVSSNGNNKVKWLTPQPYSSRYHKSGRIKRQVNVNNSNGTTQIAFKSKDGVETNRTENHILSTSSFNADNKTFTTPRLLNNFSIDFNKYNSYIFSNVVTTEGTNLVSKLPKNNTQGTSLKLTKEGDNRKKTKVNQNNNDLDTLNTLNHTYNVNQSCKFLTLLRKLLDTNKNNTKQVSSKLKRHTILTKVRKLFRKICHQKLNNDLLSKDCFLIGSEKPRQYKLKTKVKLRQKMEDLLHESENIFRTITVIKGLLRMIQLNTNETKFKINSSKTSENIDKLNTIIKATFNEDEITQKLTQEQRRQIDHIKTNVLTFIKSMGKFATTLDDIIQIAIHHNEIKNNTTFTTFSNHNHYEKVRTDKEIKMQQKLHKLMRLMLNYNNLQKKIMNQIYTLISYFVMNKTTNISFKEQSDPPIKLSKNDAIETNSANIIRNIRKLKVLADNMKIHSRRKRETIGDQDALEYLLILIEYLLKRHAPINPPVYDGIDLLIEAIKSAPDVKPIKKKVLDFIPEKTQTISGNLDYDGPVKSLQEERNNSETENGSIDVFIVNQNNNNKTSYDESDDDDNENIDEIYQKFKSCNDSTSEQKTDTETDLYTVSTTRKPYDIRKFEKTSHKIGSTYLKTINENSDKSEIPAHSTISNKEVLELESSTEYSTTLPSDIKNTVESQENETNNFLVDVKANLDWIEENFKDAKQSNETEIGLSTPNTLSATRTIKQPLNKNINNLSDISNEIDTGRLHKSKSNTDEEMTMRKMDVLKSLDYSVDKYTEDEAISKDDKYSSDDF